MSDQAKILLLDDEEAIRATLSEMLNGHYRVVTAASGEEALQQIADSRFDVALIDICLPDLSGIDVLKAIKRHHPHTVAVMMTGSATIDNAVESLRHGAVDYLRKPFSAQRLLACVQQALGKVERKKQREAAINQLSRGLQQLTSLAEETHEGEWLPEAPSEEESRLLKRGPLVIDNHRRSARLNGKLLELTPGEYDLLYALAREAPRVVGPRELVEETRDFSCSLEEARSLIRWQVYLLRQKIEEDSSSPGYIINVRGRGYMWAAV